MARDIRESGPELHQAFLQGITEAGADVIDLGITNTGVLYRATVDLSVDAAVAITASHNPPEYNGFKICQGLYQWLERNYRNSRLLSTQVVSTAGPEQ